MDYGAIVSRAWHITWNNKFLWVLGFLVALGSVGSGNSSFQSTGDAGQFDFSAPPMALLFGLACVGLILALVIWLVSLAARGGLIEAVARLDEGETITLGEAFGAGTAVLVRLVGLSLLMLSPILIFLILAIVAVGGVAFTTGFAPGNLESFGPGIGLLVACFIGLLCLLVPLGLFLSFIYPFAFRGVVLRQLGVVDAIRHGWAVLRDNVVEILLLALLFFVISMIYGFATLLVLGPLALALFMPMFIGGDFGSFGALQLAWLIGGGLLLGLVGAALNSILRAWQSSTFTLAYLEFTGKEKVLEV